MFSYFLPQFADDFGVFNVFRYLTFRSGSALMTSLILSFIIGPWFIRKMNVLQAGINNVREDVPETHTKKIGTPSMGGLMILFTTIVAIILWADLTNGFIWGGLVILCGFGMIGAIDDIQKFRAKSKGLSGKVRLLGESIIACIALAIMYYVMPKEYHFTLSFPFVKDFLLDLGYFFIIISVFIIVGAGNAVNLTDGLDGLAIVPVMIAAATLGIITWVVGNAVLSGYLQLHFIKGTGELAIICASLVGSALGFLWFNAPPAKIFMGDTGSLALGGTLGYIGVAIKHEIVLAIIGGLFIVETLSVILQVASFKLTGKRIFMMAPIHHHFEKKGWHESTIVIRFWIIALILAIIALSTLKLR